MSNYTRGFIVSDEPINTITQEVKTPLITLKEKDNINHPNHYAEGRQYEPIDVINDWELNFQLGNTVKYISRAGRKDNAIEDLEKASFYLTYEINRLKSFMTNDKND